MGSGFHGDVGCESEHFLVSLLRVPQWAREHLVYFVYCVYFVYTLDYGVMMCVN